MKRITEIIVADSIKAFFLMLAVASTTYADTNLVDESSDISTQYVAGDIVSTGGELQAEVLENIEDSIEIGLFNQEDQITAMLMWNVKANTGNVIVNLDTEDEQTLPIQISEHMNPENRMEILANGLLVMTTAQESEPLSPEKSKLRAASTSNMSVTQAVPLPVIVTDGYMDYETPFYRGKLEDNHTKRLIGNLVSSTRISGGSDKRPV